MICPSSPGTGQGTQAESAISVQRAPRGGQGLVQPFGGCVCNHCTTPPRPWGSRQRHSDPVGSLRSPNGFPKPGCQEGAGRQQTPVLPATEEPQAGAGWLRAAACRAGRVGLESSPAPRTGGPQQLFLRTAWTFQRRAADVEGPGGAWGLKQVSGALPNETHFMCKPELPAPVEGSSRPTARM